MPAAKVHEALRHRITGPERQQNQNNDPDDIGNDCNRNAQCGRELGRNATNCTPGQIKMYNRLMAINLM